MNKNSRKMVALVEISISWSAIRTYRHRCWKGMRCAKPMNSITTFFPPHFHCDIWLLMRIFIVCVCVFFPNIRKGYAISQNQACTNAIAYLKRTSVDDAKEEKKLENLLISIIHTWKFNSLYLKHYLFWNWIFPDDITHK